jgi:hypothetical protein
MGGFFSKAATRGRRGACTLMVAGLAVAVLAMSAGAAAAEPVDGTAPTVSIDAPSSHAAPGGKLRLYFSADEAGVKFMCQLDNEAAAPCASPQDFTLTAGEHVIAVSAADAAGNTSAAVTWDVTATAADPAPPPLVTIIITDPGPTTDVPPPVTPQPRTPRLEIGEACMEVSASRANARFSLRGRNAIVRFRAPAAARYAQFTLRRAHGGRRRGTVADALGYARVTGAGSTLTTRIALTARQRRSVRAGVNSLAIAYSTCRAPVGTWQWVTPPAASRR